jgi:hypothetical protein
MLEKKSGDHLKSLLKVIAPSVIKPGEPLRAVSAAA